MIIKENILNNGWHIIKFSDCIKQLNTGLNPRKNFSLGSGKLKYITAKNLTKFGTIDFSKCDFIDEEAKKIIHKRSDIIRGDILFSSRAPIGHCHLITEEPDFYDIGESIFSIRVNQDVVLPEYLCLYLVSDYFVKVASKHTTGSIIMEIRISDLMNTEIIIPPQGIQKNIAKCLNKIDRKIELNKMVNDNLEQQAKLIYDYWFTQFDFPDENGKPYCSSGGKMVWNEQLKRNIPENWAVVPLSTVFNFKSGFPFSSDLYVTKGRYKLLTIKNVQDNGINLDVDNHINDIPSNVPGYCFLKANDILMSLTGNVGRIGIMYDDGCLLNQRVALAKPVNEDLNSFVYFLLKSDMIRKQYETIANGSSQKNLSPVEAENVLIAYNEQVANHFASSANKYLKTIVSNLLENESLIHLRDWLLPILMNGQATIAD